MTADDLAVLHAEAMEFPRPWDARAFQGFLDFPGTILAAEPDGFALGRVVADEAEVLTVAVRPGARRQGIAGRCLAEVHRRAAQMGASRVFLEVAATNTGARALYSGAGYAEDGRRRAYFSLPDGTSVDAILMSKTLRRA